MRQREGGRLVAGVDEAGRGPLIGPMVVAGVVLPEDSLGRLADAGVRDSKQLEPVARERLAELIAGEAVHVIVVEVPPQLIDAVNLNRLEEDVMGFIVSRVAALWGPRLERIVVDLVGAPERLRTVLARAWRGRLVVEKRADARYLEAAAASIIAKVWRDSVIQSLSEKYGFLGSGYPTDPRTIEWVRKAYAESPEEPPPIVRRTWATLRTIAPQWYRRKSSTSSGGRRSPGTKSILDYLHGNDGGAGR